MSDPLIGVLASTELLTGVGDYPESYVVRVRIRALDVDSPVDPKWGALYEVEFTTGPRVGQITYRHTGEMRILSAVDLLGELVPE